MNNGPYYLLLEKPVAAQAWENEFLPYRIQFKENAAILEGKVFHDQTEIAEARLFTEDLRLELFPVSEDLGLLDGLLVLPAFAKICNSPITAWALRQTKHLATLQDKIDDVQNLKDWRETLCKLYVMYSLFAKAVPKEDREGQMSLMKKMLKSAGNYQDAMVLDKLLEEHGFSSLQVQLKTAKYQKKLQSVLSPTFVTGFNTLLEESRYAISGYHPNVLVAKAHRKLVKSVHKVHSARDVQALSKVCKRVKTLISISELAKLPKNKTLISLDQSLDRWHDLILFQDFLIKQKKPSKEILQVLVDLELEVRQVIGDYRHLSSEYWEEKV